LLATHFLKRGGERPVHQLAQAPDQATGSVVALVAVHENRVAVAVQNHSKRSNYDVMLCLDEWFEIPFGCKLCAVSRTNH
jgi:hypothetical protein